MNVGPGVGLVGRRTGCTHDGSHGICVRGGVALLLLLLLSIRRRRCRRRRWDTVICRHGPSRRGRARGCIVLLVLLVPSDAFEYVILRVSASHFLEPVKNLERLVVFGNSIAVCFSK